MAHNCHFCEDNQAGIGEDKCTLLMSAYIFAGLAMMLNIRLSYSSAPYALIRFRLPENLFSVFVRRMASALELWCLPSMLLGNLVEYGLKGYYLGRYTSNGDWGTHTGNLKEPSNIQITGGTGNKNITVTNLPHINDLKPARLAKLIVIIIPSIITQWLNFLTYVILFFVYRAGGDSGHLTLFYFVIAISGVVFGINMVLLYAVDWNYIPVYMVGENSFPALTSFMHYITTLIFGNRRKYDSDFLIVYVDIWVAILISLVAAVLWTLGYGYFTDTQKEAITEYQGTPTISTIKYGTPGNCNTSAGNTGATKSIDPPNDPGATLTINDITGAGTLQDIPRTPATVTVTVNTDNKTLTIKYTQAGTEKCIEITASTDTITKSNTTVAYGHIFTETFDTSKVHWEIISPALMVIVGMGLVYAIYPGIAPGMIVPFYLIDKIEMVLLIATFFPPVIVATLQKVIPQYSPKTKFAGSGMGGWKHYTYEEWVGGKPTQKTADPSFYHAFDLLIVIKILLAIIFIYSLHYRDSGLSRSIVNQPKMSTVLSILFYMCHEISLAVGFAGMVGNGANWTVLAQMIGAFLMVFLALYSEGYIIEYKSHDPQHWPTTGMTKWNAFCYWHYLTVICLFPSGFLL